jgi:hypothetical protein
MHFTFLTAADGTRLTKTIVRDPETGELGISSYPMVGRFTSAVIDCSDLSAAHEVLRSQADLGACLLKGALSEPLHNESRAGKTVTNAVTDYLVLDLDFADGFASIDTFLAALDPTLSEVSYIFQHSTSAGIKGDAGLRGHIFVMLAEPVPAPVIKQWLMDRNLSVPALRERVTLAASGMALKWPLDVTTCQNDKLIYIAPPVLLGLDDPIPERFVLRTKSKPTAHVSFAVAPQIIRDKTDALITELRRAAGLKKRTAKTRITNGEEVLLNPDRAIVTGVRQARGYTYLNLNGGDSWAYYFPDDKPELLYNFKGEPIVRLRDIAPDFFKDLTAEPGEAEFMPIVFRDRSTDTYYNGLYYPVTERLELSPTSSKDRLRDFAANFDAELPDPIPDWEYVFDPTILKTIDVELRWANQFVATPYLRDVTTPSGTMPPTIGRVIRSICGNDQETIDYFLNWLSFIFQTRTKTKTAWIFHGVPGTGKGVLLANVLMPIFGPRHVQEYTTTALEDNFNASLEQCLIQWFDEFHVEDAKSGESRIINRIKNLITEDSGMIRAMRRNATQRRLYNNIIIATNHSDPFPLDDRDRRFNVAPAQRVPLDLDQHDIDTIARELPQFAAILRDYTVDERQVQRILINDARRAMIAAAENSVDRFFDRLVTGDLDFFLQFLRDRPPLTPNNAYIEYERALKRWAANLNRQIAVSRDEAMAAYNYLQNTAVSPNKFTSMCHKHDIKIKPHRIGSKIERGLLTVWRSDQPEFVSEFIHQLNVVSIANAS